MLKRTKGRFLLTMLVITGLAGTLKDTSLTKQERKFAVADLKETRAEFFKAIKGLSENQLNFKSAPDRWSIKECAFHISLAEAHLAEILTKTMKEHAAPEKRSEVRISDEDLVKLVKNRQNKLQAPEVLRPVNGKWETLADALLEFKATRAGQIKYAKSTTEDLRDHFVQLPFGWVDAYQFMLFISGHSSRHTSQILEIRSHPDFPKN